MADARLRIIIDALNKAGDDLGKLKKDLQGVDQEAGKAKTSTEKFGGGIQSMMGKVAIAAAAVTAVSMAMKQVYQTAREGADLLYVEDRFDNLTATIGTTSDALMNDLRVATRGLKSDAELMASATDFMSLGLAKSHDEVVRLANVAGALDMNMNQLVLTLTNRTTMRFDALGVSVDGFDEKVKALEASGLSAEEAFSEAFLQQAEEQIDRVGHAADSTKGAFDRLEASFTNQADSFKKNVAEVIGPAVEAWVDMRDRMTSYEDILNETLERGIITNEEYRDIQNDVGNFVMSRAEATEYLTGKIEDHERAMEFANQDIGYYNDLAERAGVVTGNFTEDMAGLEGVTLDAALAMQSYTDKLLFKIASEGLGQDEALALAEAMGLVDENTMFAASQTDLLRKRYDEGIISADQYRDAVAALGLEIEGLQDKTVTVNVKLNDPYNVKGWQLKDQRATYTVNTVRTGDNITQQRPTGGPVSANNPYLWQEYGYRGEQFVPSQNGYVLSRADAKRILSEEKGGKIVNNYYYNLNMPTSSNPSDVGMAFELMRSYGA